MLTVKETLGRLYLWKVALDRVVELLALMKRVDRFCNTGKPLQITDLYDAERRRLETGLRLEGEDLDNFEKIHGQVFPDIHDIQLIDELLTEEIIIKFCTIFNDGYGKIGEIAKNSKAFREPIICEIISEAFSGDTKSDFIKFIEQARAYRDKHGAHFDQESFIVTHGNTKKGEDGIIYGVGWSSTLLTFDWNFANDTLPAFTKALNCYIQRLQKENGMI
ncbi:hypothetical protein I5O09_10915 [Pseudomonas parafulva]|uniref:hypothetical protein n=1 Tax=Pseudomonas parafulva TaxID=157782 RepID=UPI0018D9916D|nr:hypothetical protein [Pseudomonas parafulva]MBH3344257.1 hypothetical protein [Pseudomonas parafulva]